MSSSDAVIDIAGLTRSFGRFPALRGQDEPTVRLYEDDAARGTGEVTS